MIDLPFQMALHSKTTALDVIIPTQIRNIMDQYRPMGNVYRNEALPSELRRTITEEEYREAVRDAREHGLYRGFRYEV